MSRVPGRPGPTARVVRCLRRHLPFGMKVFNLLNGRWCLRTARDTQSRLAARGGEREGFGVRVRVTAAWQYRNQKGRRWLRESR